MQRNILGPIRGNNGAGTHQEGFQFLGQHAIVDTRDGKAFTRGQLQRKPASHAETDHADTPGTINLPAEPVPCSPDIGGYIPLPGQVVEDHRAQAFQQRAAMEQVRRRHEITFAREPVGLIARIAAHADRVMNHHYARPGAIANGLSHIGS